MEDDMKVRLRRAVFSAAVLLTSVACLSSAPALATSRSDRTVVYGFGKAPYSWSNPQVRPTHAIFSLAGENGIRHIRWQDWHRASAFGHGTILIFSGTGFTGHHGTIDLSAVRKHHGQRYFSHLVMRWVTKNGTHHREVLNWRRDHALWLWVGNYSGT
jgi:hypothetical protein